MKILLVDDDAFLRDMYVTKFTHEGDTVSIAENGLQALQTLREDTFDAVLMDLIMPGMTGLELLEAIGKEKLAPTAKYVVLSNQSESADIATATELGAHGYIIKAECIPSEVVTKVHEIVDSKK